AAMRLSSRPTWSRKASRSSSWSSERCPSRVIDVRLAIRRLFDQHDRCRRAAQSHHRGDHIDIDLEEVEIAGHLAQLLALAAKLLGGVDGYLAFGHAARGGDERPCPEPFQPRPLRIAM